MKKKLISILSFVVMIFSIFGLTGCSFNSWFKPDLDAPTIVLNSDEQKILWNGVDHATEYDIYINSEKVDTILNSKSGNYYCFSLKLNDETKLYKLYIIAKADNYNDSAKSNEVTYLNSDSNTSEVECVDITNANKNVLNNVKVSGKVISWDEKENVDKYYVFMYTNSVGQQIFETDINAFNFEPYVTDDEVVILRAGIKVDEVIQLSNQLYTNTCNLQPEYNNYMFYIDGYIGDTYITSQEELNKLIYYCFIYKIDPINVYFSDDYMNTLANTYGTNKFKHLTSALNSACSSFTETCDYDPNLTNLDSSNPKKNNFSITFSFASNEPVNSYEAVRTQNPLDKPYYETVDYVKRAVDFDNFASDNKAILQQVTTGEELYHVVESGATPTFRNNTDSAYKLYQKAKTVLRTIICDEMTEYEKVLSIFDYISYNSTYDDTIVSSDESSETSFTSYTSFYLEGVLYDGVSVCDGFSKTFALLCNMEGIDAVRITGSVYKGTQNEGLHAWNKVKVDGDWYIVDITWTVTKTGDNDFTSGGEAVNYNAKEFLSYKYFLVSDSYIAKTHTASDTLRNVSRPANNDYYYYSTSTYDGVHNRIIRSDEDFETLVNYMLQHKQYGMEVAFSQEYITLQIYYSTMHDSQLSAACKRVKTACGFPDGNILIIGVTTQKVTGNLYGSIYNINLINLPDSILNGTQEAA